MRTKDTRLRRRRAQSELGELISRVSEPDTWRSGAETMGFSVLKLVMEAYVTDEGPLGVALRSFLRELQDKGDALRRDIAPEWWAALWPSINTLTHARRSYLDGRETEARSSAPSTGTPEAPGDVRPGLLRAGPDSGGDTQCS